MPEEIWCGYCLTLTDHEMEACPHLHPIIERPKLPPNPLLIPEAPDYAQAMGDMVRLKNLRNWQPSIIRRRRADLEPEPPAW